MAERTQFSLSKTKAPTEIFPASVNDGIHSGFTVVSALTVGEEVVATLLGIRRGTRYSCAPQQWRFRVTRFPLSDITTALGWRGLP